MTKHDQLRYIHDILNVTYLDIMGEIERVPDAWGRPELARWLVDRVTEGALDAILEGSVEDKIYLEEREEAGI